MWVLVISSKLWATDNFYCNFKLNQKLLGQSVAFGL